MRDEPDVRVVVLRWPLCGCDAPAMKESPAAAACRLGAGLNVGTPFFVRYGRVKGEDPDWRNSRREVVVRLLVGDGAGQSESLSCYAVYSPRVATRKSRRMRQNLYFKRIHQGDAASKKLPP